MDIKDTIEQEGPIEITDATAKLWYDIGFKFAINYLIAWMPTFDSDGLDVDEFRAMIGRVVGEEVIDDDYFKKLFYYVDNNRYGRLCPDPNDPNVCISCTGGKVQPVPRP